MTTSLLLLLQQQLSQLIQMNELLVCEREAFISRSVENVTTTGQQKLAALQRLQDTDKQIISNFSQTDFEHEDIKPIKTQIDEALAELKNQNIVNGKIIQNNQVNLNMLKDVLVGTKKDRSAMTYNQSGQKSSALKSRPIKA